MVEVHGYYLAAPSTATGMGGFVRLPPERLTGKIEANGIHTITIGNGSPVPADAAAALLTIIVVDATEPGQLRAFPAGVTPSGSTIDYMPGMTSVMTAVRLSPEGMISFTASGAELYLVVDVVGYFTSRPDQGAGLRTVPGSRIYDTVTAGTPIPPNSEVDIQVGGVSGLPTRGIAGAVLNLTTVNPGDSGFLQVWPSGETESSSALHRVAESENRASMAIVRPGVEGKVRIKNSTRKPVNLLVDLQGWYAEPLPPAPVARNTPVRIIQLAPGDGEDLGTLAYAFVDNLGQLRYGRQPDPSRFDTLRWSSLSTDEVFIGPPALTQLPDERVQVVAQYGDSNIQSMSQTTAGGEGWNDWTKLGGSMAAPPVADSLASGVTVLFGVDADGRLWHYRQEGSRPFWQSLGDADLTGGIAVGPARNGLRIVAIGSEGAAKTAVYHDSGMLGSWTDLGGSKLTGTPAIEVLPGFRTRIVARDKAGRVMTKYQLASGKFRTDWDRVGDLTAAGSPDIIFDSKYRRFCVVARATDNRVYAIWETAVASDTWGTWEDSGVGTVFTDPTATEYSSADGRAWIIAGLDFNGDVRYAVRDAAPSATLGAERGSTKQSFRTGVLPGPPMDG
jgi:hypothetical protein